MAAVRKRCYEPSHSVIRSGRGHLHVLLISWPKLVEEHFNNFKQLTVLELWNEKIFWYFK